MSAPKNPPAFPSGAFVAGFDGFVRAVASTEEGMTLRDWFAGQALPWALSLDYGNDWGKSGKGHAPLAAARAYAVADAMLAERAKAGADQ